MITSKSPRKVLQARRTSWASRLLPKYASRFSRHDEFTEPQLFACLVLREHQKKSYRGVEALLCRQPALAGGHRPDHAPDHNTLCRAFNGSSTAA